MRCHAACLAGRVGYGRGKALLGLSWGLCAQIRAHLVRGLPKPSLQRARERQGSPALGTEAPVDRRGAGSGSAEVEGSQEKPCVGASPILQAPTHPSESPQLTSPCPPALLCNHVLG